MDKESTQPTVDSPREYETPRLVDYGRLHSQTTGGTAHASETNHGVAKPRP
jgi:hypothetical protein